MPWPKEGAPASVYHLPWTCPPPMPCLSPWQPNSAVPTSHLTAAVKPCPLLKGAQLNLLWGGWCLIWMPSLSTSPMPGGPRSAPPPQSPSCQEHSKHLSRGQPLPFPEKAAAAALGMTWTARDLSSLFAPLWASVSCWSLRPLKAWLHG